MAVSRQKNAAFTLVELLVVITILGMLMALLVPAVNSVRESMRRTQCKNSLKQIGTAASAHVSQFGFFPSDGWGSLWLGDADRGTGASQPGSWIYQLLPFMGFDMIHDIGKGDGKGLSSGSFNSTTGDGKYTAGPEMKKAVIPSFICTTRRRPVAYPDGIQQGAINSAPAITLNKTDYAANAGSNAPTAYIKGPTVACLGTYPNCISSDTNQAPGWDANASAGNGVVYQASQVTPGNIPDGLSVTFFAGEKSLDPNFYNNSMEQGDDNSMLQGFDRDTVRWCWTPSTTPPTSAVTLDTRNSGVTQANSSGPTEGTDYQFGSGIPPGANSFFATAAWGLFPSKSTPQSSRIWGNATMAMAPPAKATGESECTPTCKGHFFDLPKPT